MSSSPHSEFEASSGPLPLFDYHLKLLEESYIQFFQERIRIEEVYVDSLRRLHLKHRALDTYRDDRSDRGSTVRRAWREIGDNTERETDTREAFLANLKTEILVPLAALKETQDRTRKRIKEDMKNVTNAHLEYAENVLPRFKRSYLKKCQEAEDYKSDKHVPNAALSTATSPQQSDQSLAKVTSNPIGSPMPMRPTARQPSVHLHTGGRNRSPSSSTPFSDLAHQGKKQLNTLMTFLNEGGKGGPASSGGHRTENALRSVRARREADEADKEYRKGVHWLETLRLHRVKTLESGYNSLESFVSESAETMKTVLERYVDSQVATSATVTQLTNHVDSTIREISPPHDTSIVSSINSRAMTRDIPKPVLYYNYTVGECHDLIFGVALVDYATAHNIPEGAVPKVIDLCVNEVEARGMETEGIYRVSGRHANVQELKHQIERDERAFHFNPAVDDISCVASMLKLYLRELPEPVFRFPLSERIQHTDEREEQVVNNFPMLRSKLRRLPVVHQATLRRVVEHLSRVASKSQRNKMDAKNLAIVFGAVIFGEDEMPKGGDILSMQNWKDSVMEDLIIHAPLLFDDGAIQNEPPLPPAPSDEPKPKYDFGSSYTQIATLPPRPQEAQDFTPSLPARPGQSIHPKRRSHQQAPRNSEDQEDDGPPVSSSVGMSPPSTLHSAEPPVRETGSSDDKTPSMMPPAYSDDRTLSVLPAAHSDDKTPSVPPTARSDDKTPSVPPTAHSDVTVTTSSTRVDAEKEAEEIPANSPKTPDTFATADSSLRTPKSSRPSSPISSSAETPQPVRIVKSNEGAISM